MQIQQQIASRAVIDQTIPVIRRNRTSSFLYSLEAISMPNSGTLGAIHDVAIDPMNPTTLHVIPNCPATSGPW